jgi:hypothetical protein
MDLIEGTEHGDNIGYINWSAVTAVTARFVPERPADDDDQPQAPKSPYGVAARIKAANAITRDRHR